MPTEATHTRSRSVQTVGAETTPPRRPEAIYLQGTKTPISLLTRRISASHIDNAYSAQVSKPLSMVKAVYEKHSPPTHPIERPEPIKQKQQKKHSPGFGPLSKKHNRALLLSYTGDFDYPRLEGLIASTVKPLSGRPCFSLNTEGTLAPNVFFIDTIDLYICPKTPSEDVFHTALNGAEPETLPSLNTTLFKDTYSKTPAEFFVSRLLTQPTMNLETAQKKPLQPKWPQISSILKSMGISTNDEAGDKLRKEMHLKWKRLRHTREGPDPDYDEKLAKTYCEYLKDTAFFMAMEASIDTFLSKSTKGRDQHSIQQRIRCIQFLLEEACGFQLFIEKYNLHQILYIREPVPVISYTLRKLLPAATTKKLLIEREGSKRWLDAKNIEEEHYLQLYQSWRPYKHQPYLSHPLMSKIVKSLKPYKKRPTPILEHTKESEIAHAIKIKLHESQSNLFFIQELNKKSQTAELSKDETIKIEEFLILIHDLLSHPRLAVPTKTIKIPHAEGRSDDPDSGCESASNSPSKHPSTSTPIQQRAKIKAMPLTIKMCEPATVTALQQPHDASCRPKTAEFTVDSIKIEYRKHCGRFSLAQYTLFAQPRSVETVIDTLKKRSAENKIGASQKTLNALNIRIN